MRKIIITIAAICSLSFASYYDVGDFINDTHQNISKSTCYAGNDYNVGDSWKLADWNGTTNGGHYDVIYIDMSASW